MSPNPLGTGAAAGPVSARWVLWLALLGVGAPGCGSGGNAAKQPASTVADAGQDATTAYDAGAQDGAPAADADASTPPDASTPADGGTAAAVFSSATIGLGMVGCGQSGTGSFAIANTGSGDLTVSASTLGAGFSVSPATLTVAPGASGMLGISTTVPPSSTAGTAVAGSLIVFTNDPAHPSATIPLSVMPTGATVALAPSSPTSAAFPSTEVGVAAAPITLTLVNTGNAPATVSLAPPADAQFSISAAGGASATVSPGATLVATTGFKPNPSTTNASSTSSVTLTGTTCGTSLSTIAFTGSVGRGQISGWPTAPINFGPVACGGAAPPFQMVVLSNSGTTNATVTSATITGAPGFTSTAQGVVIPAGATGGFAINAPAVPALSPINPVSATLTIYTDADSSPHTITLTEQPQGAVLAFDTAGTPSFGSFGTIVLLQSASQGFKVTNTGSAPATVTLSTGAPAADAGPSPFTIATPSFTIPAGGTQADAVLFSPTGTTNTGAITMTATGTLCAALPSPLPLSGAGTGGGPALTPTSLAFAATCGGGAPATQTFKFSNKGTANLNWSMSAPTGAGQAHYQLSASPPPGVLSPGQSSTVTVTAAAVPSPAPSLDVAQYAAQVAITTDVPFDPPHVVTLSEAPLGDVLALSVSSLRFGQFPIGNSTVGQTFTVTNYANSASPAAAVSFSITGSGAAAYSLSSASIPNVASGGGVAGPESVVFHPTSAVSYPASITLATADSLCAPLPTALTLSGTGTQGKVSVSATTLAFGSDANDPSGLVNCGATGLARTFTVSNTGNQQVTITGLSLALGSSSAYTLSGEALPLPTVDGGAGGGFPLPIGGSTTITVTPKAIPANVANPNDPTPFTDTLTVTTDAALDAPHRISLVMQARGAVIANTPLNTTWNFGTLGNGLIGTFSATITNTGNAAASIAFQGLSHPTIFGLQGAPVTVAANGVTQIVGQFAPPATNQVWTDQGTLVVTAAQAFCAPLPASWNSPSITLSGSSISGSLPVAVSGDLAFPSTDCGNAAPAARSVTLTNTTNIAYVFTAQLSSGAFYTLQNPTTGDASAGIIPGNGVVVLGVTPRTITPGPGVVAGSAPYADDLVVSIQSPTPSGVTIPISWTLNGAILSLPQGLGPNRDASGNAFYAADSQSGLTLPIANSGTGAASVSFGIQPLGAFSFSPAPPVSVVPGITALPRLTSASSDATCPATTAGSVTFLYAGPVCQPIPVSQVTIQSCVGTF